MLYIDNNGNIKIDRGDTFETPLFIDISDDIFKSIRYTLKTGDEVLFHLLLPNSSFEWPILGKRLTIEDTNENGDLIIRFEHEDTVRLCPGTYFYEVKLITKTDNEKKEYITIIPRRKFIII